MIDLNETLARIVTHESMRFSISMPPRHSKSESTSLWLPVWYLWMRSQHRIILASYAAEFAQSWGRKVRDKIVEYQDFFQFKLSDSSQAQDQWETDQGGGMKTAGRDGGVTGFGANLLIIDDLIKNWEEAMSPTVRESAWNFWQAAAATRLEPGASVAMIGTRWHEDDPIGRIESMERKLIEEGEETEGWQFFVYPAVANNLGVNPDGTPKRDNLGRKDGDPLWPERYDEKAFVRIRRNVGESVWNALYQQSPVPPDGDFFRRDWIRTYKLSTGKDGKDYVVLQYNDGRFESFSVEDMQAFLVADLAMTVKKENDATAIGVFWMTPRRHLILKEMYHGRMTGPDVEKKLRELYQANHCMFMAIENRVNGIVALQRFADMGFMTKVIQANNDKIQRAIPLQSFMEQGRLFLPEDFPYWTVFYREFLKFPKGKHDDVVDMFAHAAKVLVDYTYDMDGDVVVTDIEEEFQENGEFL